MASPSPAKSNIDGVNTTPSSKSLRGLNKPKCIKCGNVARSRCPYQSCKNCCAKAQNPCHIHVLKGSSSFPDKQPSSSSPHDQQSTEVSHPGNSHRLRQLSNNFAQFNNLQSPIRSRKPLTKKDAQVINEWRFLKLKEFRDKNMEFESEAFDRYLRNVSLLEEVFQVNSDDQSQDTGVCSDSESTHVRMVQAVKLKLRSDSVRSDNMRKRIKYVVDQGLKKVGKTESTDEAGEPSDIGGERAAKKTKTSSRAERVTALTDLNDKMNKARNLEDLNACWELGAQIFGWNAKTGQTGPGEVQPSSENDVKDEPCIEKGSVFSPPKWFNVVPVSHEELCQVYAESQTLQNIEEL